MDGHSEDFVQCPVTYLSLVINEKIDFFFYDALLQSMFSVFVM